MPIQQMLIGITKAEQFAEATGGTVTEVGDYKVHTFTSSGTFTVTQLGEVNEFETLIVAGGAGPGNTFSAGGGGGGGIINHQTGQALTAAAYTITVGGGGSGAGTTSSWPNTPTGNEGSDSSIKLASDSSIILEADISDIAPSSGRSDPNPPANNQATWSSYAHFIGGNSAKVVNGTITQYQGGSGYHSVGYAGGGAGSGENGDHANSVNDPSPSGYSYTPSWATGGSYSAGGGGGDGYATTMVTGSTTYYGGGGGAGTAAAGASNMTTYQAPGGQGGGGNGANRHYTSTGATNGAANTGGGGGGGHSNAFGGNAHNAGNGGSGVVFIKYKFK